MNNYVPHEEIIPVVHEAKEKRFVVNVDSMRAYIQYEPRKSDLWLITDMQVKKDRRQSQVGAKLIASLLSYASSKNKKVIPLSGKVKYIFENNTSYMSHLYQG